MSDLLDSVLKAQGGSVGTSFPMSEPALSAAASSGGSKGLVQDQPPRQMTVALRRPTASGC